MVFVGLDWVVFKIFNVGLVFFCLICVFGWEVVFLVELGIELE